MRKSIPLGAILKDIRRLVTKPERVHIIYDKERTAINPRPAAHVYAPIERLLREREEAFLATLDMLAPVLRGPEIESVPPTTQDPTQPYWENGYFSALDARIAFALTAVKRPARIIEIGSGNSTKFFRKAVNDFAVPCQITSIDPLPRAEIDGVTDQLIRKNLLEVDVGLFDDLGENDILFLDGSHYVFNGTDTTKFFLEILPGIRPGVLVHVHDICLPFEYNDLFTERMYNEQYLLACTIMNRAAWRPLLPNYYLEAKGHFAGFPASAMANTSFWMTRV